jgi:hypothetical protein
MKEITSKKEGFRRAGVAHSAQPTVYPDDAFTEEEWAALEAEAFLTLQDVPTPEHGNEGAAVKRTRKSRGAE